jgi:MFS family permease
MRRTVLIHLWAMALIAYVQRTAISVPLEEIGRDVNASTAGFAGATQALGFLQSAWYFGYAICQLPGGGLADRFGGRRALVLLAVFWSLATLGAAFARSYWGLVAVWTLMGCLQAGAFPSAVRTLGLVFDDRERARASSWLGAGMLAGGAIAPALTAAVIERVAAWPQAAGIAPWRVCLAAYALPGLLWAAAYWFATRSAGLDAAPAGARSGYVRRRLGGGKSLVADGRSGHRLLERSPTPVAYPGWFAKASLQSTRMRSSAASAPAAPVWRALATDRTVWLLCGQQFLRAAAMLFFVTWFPTFLRETRGVSLLQSGLLTTYAGAAALAGILAGGQASDWLLARNGSKRLARQGLAVLGMTACAVLMLLSAFVSSVDAAIVLISLGAFSATFGGVAGYTVAIDYGGDRVGTVFGAMNTAGGFGAMLFPVTIGWLVAATGTWNAALVAFVILMAVDAVLWAVLNPRGTFMSPAPETGPAMASR